MSTPNLLPFPRYEVIASGMWWRLIAICVMPCARNQAMLCASRGRPPTSIIGLGQASVNGPRRVPLPPASISAFTLVCAFALEDRRECLEEQNLHVQPNAVIAD